MSQTKAELIEPQGNVAFDTNTLYVDAGNNRVGIGTTSPTKSLEVAAGNTSANGILVTGSSSPRILVTETTGSVTNWLACDASAGYAGTISNHPYAIYTNALERGRWDSSGRLLVGTSTARSNLYNSNNPLVQFETTGSSIPNNWSAIANRNDAFGPELVIGKSRGSAVNSVTAVQNGDILGLIQFVGADGTTLIRAASVSVEVDGTPGTNDMPGRLVFSTTADGASSSTTRLTIPKDGNTSISNSSAFFPVTDNAVSLGINGGRWSAVWAANGTIQTSDERAKKDIEDASLGSDFIKSLRPVSYKWIEGGKRDTGERDEDNNYIYESVSGTRTHWGFIAQEVKQVVDAAGVDFGGWVLTDKDDPDSQQALRYDQFIAPLTKALQEALAEIDVLKAKVAALEAQ